MTSAVQTKIETEHDRLADLAERVARRDRAAFAELYRATSPKVFGILTRILGRGPAAEDAMQDVYASVWRRAGDFDRERGAFLGWMAVIARNRAIDEVRRTRVVFVELDEDGTPGQSEDPLMEQNLGEERRRLLLCLTKLPPDRRDAVLLAYYRGLSREDLSRRFDRPVATIKTLLRRSLLLLRTCMTQ